MVTTQSEPTSEPAMASKKESPVIEHFRFCFKLLTLIGLHPSNFVTPLVIFNMVVSTVCLALGIIQTYLDFSLAQLEIITLPLQFLVKQCSLAINLSTARDMLEDLKAFWPINLPETRRLSIFLKMQPYYLTWMSISFTHIITNPLIMGGSALGCYLPPQIPYAVMYLFELYVCIISVITFVGLNLLCCLLITMAGEQFHLLNRKLRSMDLSKVKNADDLREYRAVFKEYVIYHNILLKYVDKLNGILSKPLFFTMGISITALCFSMYNAKERLDTLILKFRLGFIAFYVITEYFLCYGHPTQIMMDEAEDVGNSLYYYTEWYLPNLLPLRKDIQLMMLRSQKPTYISAEGLFLINNTTTLMLMKTAYSFFTFLQTVEQDPSD